MKAVPAVQPHLLLNGHHAPITELAFSSDNKTLASSSRDGSVILWDIATGEMKSRFSEICDRSDFCCFSFALSPVGKLLTTSFGSELKLWDTANGELKRKISKINKRFSRSPLTFSPDGSILAIPYRTKWTGFDQLELLNLQTNTSLHLHCETDDIEKVQFSYDGSIVAIYSRRDRGSALIYELSLWDTISGQQIGIVQEKDNPLGCFSFVAGENVLVVTQAYKLVWLDLINAKVRRSLYLSAKNSSLETEEILALSFNGRFALTQIRNWKDYCTPWLGLWDLQNGRLQWQIKAPHHFPSIDVVGFSPDGSILATYDRNVINLLDTQSGTLMQQLGQPQVNMNALTFNPDGQMLIVAGADGTVYQWNPNSAALKRVEGNEGYKNPSTAISPEGGLFAISSSNRFSTTKLKDRIKVRESHDGPTLWKHRLHESINSLAFSPDGDSLAGSNSTHACIWNSRNGKLKREWEHGGQYRASIAYSPDGKLLATAFEEKGKENAVRLFDADTGEFLRSFDKGETTYVGSCSVVFSPDGKTLASGDDDHGHKVRLWDVRTGKLKRCFKTDDAPHAITFSPDGKLIAIGAAYNNSIWIYHLRTGKQQMLHGHTGSIEAIDFSPDGHRIASAASDGTVKLWDIQSGELLVLLLILPAAGTEASSAEWLAFTPDGYYSGSPGAERFLHWQKGTTIYKATKFKRPRRRGVLG